MPITKDSEIGGLPLDAQVMVLDLRTKDLANLKIDTKNAVNRELKEFENRMLGLLKEKADKEHTHAPSPEKKKLFKWF